MKIFFFLFIFMLSQHSLAIEINLELAMDFAENSSKEEKIAALATQSFVIKKQLSYFGLGPSLWAAAETTWDSAQTNTFPRLGTFTKKSQKISASLEQPISDIFKQFFEIKKQDTLYQSAKFNQDAKKITARIQGAFAFVNAQKAQRILQIREEALKIAQQLVKEGEVFFRTGAKTKADLAQLEVTLAQAQLEVLNAKANKEFTFLALAKTLGLEEEQTIEIPFYHSKSAWELKKEHTIFEKPNAHLSLSQRPDLKSLSLKITSAHIEKHISIFDFLPKISASTVWSYEPANQDSSPMVTQSSLSTSTEKQ
ncbi:MAG: TolC family protein, partial [Silvanigrellaceae bacterium]|nr:TolC family protein [Silvanigrellaceae bacterium]